MPELANSSNADLSGGFTVPQVAEKHACPVGLEDRTGGWTEPMVWSVALEGKDDLERFKQLNWGLRTWDLWNWTDCLPREIHVNDKQSVFHWGDRRFGDDWPGRIPAQMIGHILYYFSKQNDLIFDPMGGGGVTPDTCLVFNRRCWTLDMIDRPDTRAEIEPYYWDMKNLQWPIRGKAKPDLILFDPPYFDKKAEGYAEKSISSLTRQEYLEFFEGFFTLMKHCTKKPRDLPLSMPIGGTFKIKVHSMKPLKILS